MLASGPLAGGFLSHSRRPQRCSGRCRASREVSLLRAAWVPCESPDLQLRFQRHRKKTASTAFCEPVSSSSCPQEARIANADPTQFADGPT